jgi:hypothetical protein
MHFCSPPFRLSKAPKRSAIPASGTSEKHVVLNLHYTGLTRAAPPRTMAHASGAHSTPWNGDGEVTG